MGFVPRKFIVYDYDALRSDVKGAASWIAPGKLFRLPEAN